MTGRSQTPAKSPVSCSEKLKAIADPTRYSVLQELMKQPMLVGELERVLHIEQSLLSHHLRILRNAQLVNAVRSGKAVRYSIAKGVTAGKRESGIDLDCCKLIFD